MMLHLEECRDGPKARQGCDVVEGAGQERGRDEVARVADEARLGVVDEDEMAAIVGDVDVPLAVDGAWSNETPKLVNVKSETTCKVFGSIWVTWFVP